MQHGDSGVKDEAELKRVVIKRSCGAGMQWRMTGFVEKLSRGG